MLEQKANVRRESAGEREWDSEQRDHQEESELRRSRGGVRAATRSYPSGPAPELNPLWATYTKSVRQLRHGADLIVQLQLTLDHLLDVGRANWADLRSERVE